MRMTDSIPFVHKRPIMDWNFPTVSATADDDDEDDYFDSFFLEPNPIDMQERLREVNRALAEDSTPIDCNRKTKLRFKEVIAEYKSPRESESDDGYGDSADLVFDVDDDSDSGMTSNTTNSATIANKASDPCSDVITTKTDFSSTSLFLRSKPPSPSNQNHDAKSSSPSSISEQDLSSVRDTAVECVSKTTHCSSEAVLSASSTVSSTQQSSPSHSEKREEKFTALPSPTNLSARPLSDSDKVTSAANSQNPEEENEYSTPESTSTSEESEISEEEGVSHSAEEEIEELIDGKQDSLVVSNLEQRVSDQVEPLNQKEKVVQVASEGDTEQYKTLFTGLKVEIRPNHPRNNNETKNDRDFKGKSDDGSKTIMPAGRLGKSVTPHLLTPKMVRKGSPVYAALPKYSPSPTRSPPSPLKSSRPETYMPLYSTKSNPVTSTPAIKPALTTERFSQPTPITDRFSKANSSAGFSKSSSRSPLTAPVQSTIPQKEYLMKSTKSLKQPFQSGRKPMKAFPNKALSSNAGASDVLYVTSHKHLPMTGVRKAASTTDLSICHGSSESEFIYKSWLRQKNREAVNQKKHEKLLKAAAEAEAEEQTRRRSEQAKEAFQTWLMHKREQMKLEKQMRNHHRRHEQHVYTRTREECEEAYKVWCQRKKEELELLKRRSGSSIRSSSLERARAQEKTRRIYSAYLSSH